MLSISNLVGENMSEEQSSAGVATEQTPRHSGGTTTGSRSWGRHHRNRRPRQRLIGYLDFPCQPQKWFLLDLLGVAMVCSLILGALYFLWIRFPDLFQEKMTPLHLFIGNAVAPIVAITVLAAALTMAFAHIRYLLAKRGDFWSYAVLSLLLMLVSGIFVGYSMFAFFGDFARFQLYLLAFGIVQLLLVVVIVYFSAVLKFEIIKSLYDHTIHAGIARLHLMKARGNASSDGERGWLDEHRSQRQAELNELDRLRREHDDHLRQL